MKEDFRIYFTPLDSEGNHVVLIDGKRVGYALSEDDARTIVSWLKHAVTEEIEIARKDQ